MFGIKERAAERAKALRSQIDSTRIKLSTTETSKDILELAEKAKTVLGYSVLRNRTLLRDVLCELEIEVLDPKIVKKYMEEVARSKNGVLGGDWRWGALTLAKYTEPVPEFVLNKAIQVAERLEELYLKPQMELRVHYFTNDDREVYPDPFLSVKLGFYSGYEMYYIEVWDENKFEGRISK